MESKNLNEKTQQKVIDFLPKDQKDLAKREYWKKFFEVDRFKDGFEWYASFDDLKGYLKQHCKDKADGGTLNIVVPGCGNSDLSEKLCRDLQIKNVFVESFDYEEQVVESMQSSKPADLPLNYSIGDCTNLKKQYEDGKFDVAVDKGTFDALAVDDSPETVSRCWAYFNETVRVLAKDGVFVIVSLLQPHVLKIFVDFFIRDNEQNIYRENNLYQVKFQKIQQIEGYAEKNFIKYYVTVKKNYIDKENAKMVAFRQKQQDMVGLMDGLTDKEVLYPCDQAIEKIKIDQQVYMIAPRMKVLEPGRQIEMHCYDFKSQENQNVPKYTLNVVDSNNKDHLKSNNCAAIITPQGRETDSSFCTERGRQDLCQQTKMSRIIVVMLGHGHTFGTLDDITKELSPKVQELAPTNCANYDTIPFMTAGGDIGQKALIDVKSDDKIEGIIVQDVKSEDTGPGISLRQVIFEDKPDQIQSEIQMVYRDPKKHQIADHMVANSKMCPKKKGKVAVLNHDALTSEYHQVMLAGMSQAPELMQLQKLRVLHLGTGAGTFPMFLKSQLADKLEKLITVDISKDILAIAKKYFGFNPDGAVLESIEADAYEYVNKLAAERSEQPFDIIFMDINYSADDVSISPPKKFLESAFLQKLLTLCAQKCAYVCINVQIYSDEALQELIKELAALKEGQDGPERVAYYQVEDARNCIVMIARTQDAHNKDKSNGDKLSDILKAWNISNKNTWLKEYGMSDIANSITNEIKAGKEINGKK